MIVVWGHEVAGHVLAGFGVNGIGIYGAWLFFVLSGFLITGILLRERDNPAAAKRGHSNFLRSFYARRMLRIAPAYFVLVLVLAVFDLVPDIRRDLVGHLTYMSNWVMFVRNKFSLGVGSFWTLAVEFHFYLVWPFVILFASKRRLPWILACVVAVAVIFRGVMVSFFVTPVRVAVPTFASMDCLALGSLLAWHVHTHPENKPSRNRAMTIALVSGLALIAVTFVLSFAVGQGYRLFAMIEALGMGLVSVFLVGHAASGFRGLTGKVLSFKPIVYIGTVSYGIYLYHGPINWGLRNWPGGPAIGRMFGAETNGWQRFVFVSILSIAIASVSWFALELPMLDLKRKFPYS